MKPELLVRGSAPVDGPSGAASAAPANRTDERELQDRARRFERALSQPNTPRSPRPNQQPNTPSDPRPLNRDAVDAALGAVDEWPVETGLSPAGATRYAADRDASAKIAPGVDLQALADHLAERLAEGALGASPPHSPSGGGSGSGAGAGAALSTVALRRGGASNGLGAAELGAGLANPSAGSAGGSGVSPLGTAPSGGPLAAPLPALLRDVAARTDPRSTAVVPLGAGATSEGMAGSTTPLASPPPAAPSAAGLIATGGAASGITAARSFAAGLTAEGEPVPAPGAPRVVTGLPAGTELGTWGASRSDPVDLGFARAQVQGLALALGQVTGQVPGQVPGHFSGKLAQSAAGLWTAQVPATVVAAPTLALNAVATSAGSPPQSSGGGSVGGPGGDGGALADQGEMGHGTDPLVSASRRLNDPLDALTLGGAATPTQPPLPLPLPAVANASLAAPTPGAPSGAEAVWRQVQDMALRMAAGTGANGAHQIRLEIDPRLLPGVQVTLQMSAGQMQMEFVCSNDVSRRRLRAAAQRELGAMASRLGCPVQVTLRADGPDAGAATGRGDDAEYLHAAA